MKRLFSIVLCTVLIFSSMNVFVYAIPEKNTSEIFLQNYNVAKKIEGLQDVKAVHKTQYRSAKYPNGKSGQVLPDQYKTPNLAPIRDQNPYGTCWAFASTTISEMSINRQEQQSTGDLMDLSEHHLAYFTYHTAVDPLGGTEGDQNRVGGNEDYLNLGSNLYLSTQILTGWAGLTSEADFPYSNALQSIDASNAYNKDIAHLRNVYYINMHENPEIAKEMIIKYGGVAIAFYAETDDQKYTNYYSVEKNAYYCYDEYDLNHFVTVVGWDDTFPKENFVTEPEKDGAWIIRNSWGYEGESYYGYFYMSYCDKSIDSYGYAYDVVSKQSEDYYNHNYQYDGSAMSNYISNETDTMTCANIFTSKFAHEKLTAVSFSIDDVECEYTVDVYRNLIDIDNPESGTKVASMTGTTTCGGYYTIPLTEYVTLQKDDIYSVVVTLHKPDAIVSFTAETNWDDWMNCTAMAKKGQSFIKVGDTWIDYGEESNCNLRIKAFTNDIANVVPTSSITIHGEKHTMKVGETQMLSASILPDNATYQRIVWSSENDTIATVDMNGNVTAKAPGSVSIIATTIDGTISDQYLITVENVLTGISLNISNVELHIGHRSEPLVVSYLPEGATGETTISSKNEEVAVVKDGCIIAVRAGVTTVEAICGSYRATCQVYVMPDNPVVSATWNQSSQSVILSWNKIKGVSGYRVYKENIGGSIEIADCVGDDTISYEDMLEKGQCTYTVKPYVTYAEGELISSSSAVVKYKIMYEVNGGSNNADNPSIYDYTTAEVMLRNPTKEGYTFEGWYADAAFSQGITKISGVNIGDLMLYAKWKKNVDPTPAINTSTIKSYTYTVKFDGNGATSGKVKTLTNRKSGVKYNMPTNSYKRKGYVFVGWNTQKNGKGKTYKAKAKFVNLTSGKKMITLYAKWKKIASTSIIRSYTYTVKFSGNGATSGKVKTLTNRKSGVKYRMPTNSYKRKGYVFVEWNTQKNGKGKTYKAKTKFMNLTSGKKTITLYAIWRKNK